MNKTIDYGKHPKAGANYQAVPVDPKVSSSITFPPLTQVPGLAVALGTYDVQRLKYSGKDGYGHGDCDRKESLEGYFLDISYHGSTVMTQSRRSRSVWVLPAHASANSEKGPSKSKVLAMVSVAYSRGQFLDTVFLEWIFNAERKLGMQQAGKKRILAMEYL